MAHWLNDRMERDVLAIFTAINECQSIVTRAKIRVVVVIEERVG
jgi:hypothetical protein